MMITYEFHFPDGQVRKFDVDLNRLAADAAVVHPEWTRLEFHQCPNCPLTPKEIAHCPAAVDIDKIVDVFSGTLSHLPVTVKVITEERTSLKDTDVQSGLKALMGLVMATSFCPVLKEFRGMAHFHLPFSSLAETVVRSISFHLIKKLYRAREGKAEDYSLDGLMAQFDALGTVNLAFTERVNAAAKEDANLNAIVYLHADSSMAPMGLDDILGELKPLFT